MTIPSEPPGAEYSDDVPNAKLPEKLVRGDLIMDFDAANPADHGTIISAEPLQFRGIRPPCFTSVQHRKLILFFWLLDIGELTKKKNLPIVSSIASSNFDH